ncbi:hypothetical protein AUC70_14525 [Methyloceanibacter stevinii]|uniref:SH3b domain-containing protein n=1 Tax=Methyloceanibacter stevinii TaxID=1774970 RepID=A0A1E3VSJ1_9HYPH|nr:hypothetical protein [Methyloceanibacter stevinii]ODR96495.1 hypothetical protein AUC70_14525 [Methyloceanibacter stevinii]
MMTFETPVPQILKLLFSVMAFALAVLIYAPSEATAASAAAKRPASIHAAPNTKAKVLGLIGISQVVEAKSCKSGWCRVGPGYVRASSLRFFKEREGYESAYDYNAPLPPPNYGYTPGFWGFGGKRYYDRFGNYTKYAVPGYRGPVGPLEGTVETRRGLFGRR